MKRGMYFVAAMRGSPVHPNVNGVNFPVDMSSEETQIL